MSFLDNLENNLKSLETQQDGAEDAARRQRSREQQRAGAQASAAAADELKKGPYTQELLKQAVRIGHEMRVKVHVAWLGTTLRMEARGMRMELRPTPKGVVAAYLEGNQETRQHSVDLKGDPAVLLREWLTSLPAPPPAPVEEMEE